MNIESVILGSIIEDNSLMVTAIRKLQPNYFSTWEYKDMFALMIELQSQDKVISYTSLYTTMSVRHSNVSDIIHNCIDNATYNYKDFIYCVDALIENACKRRFSELKERLINNLNDASIDSNTLYEVTNTALQDVSKAKYQSEITTINEDVQSYLNTYLKERNGEIKRSLSTNIKMLDDKLGGGLKTGLYIVGARSSVGKTSFALQLSRNIAQSKKVMFISIEMTKNEIIEKIFLSTIKDNADKEAFKSRSKSFEWSKLTQHVDTPMFKNMYIDDSSQRTVLDIVNLVREYNRRGKCDVAVIDYLQLIDTTDLNAQTREREIAIATRALKNMSKECDIPVVLLCQLNRQVETRSDKKPCMADLRESGSIEQDANVVLLLYKPRLAKLDTYTTLSGREIDTTGLLVCIVDKNRSGECGEIYLRYNYDMSNIIDRDSNAEDIDLTKPYSQGYEEDDLPF